VVEFALIAPVMLLICFSAVDLARGFHLAMTVTSAARAGLHYASVSDANANDNAGVESAALRDANNLEGLQATAGQFCTCSTGGGRVACATTCSARSRYVEVEVRVPFDTVMPIGRLAPALTVRDKAVIRVQ
jgi:Flp pilus assembly protein TadG